MTPQEKMRDRLTACGIPFEDVKCYGSQIMVTSIGRDTATRWAELLANFARVRGVTECAEYNKANRGTCLLPTTHKVWRVWATV